MSHPFGDLLHQHLSRKRGLSQSRLAQGVDLDTAVISKMCRGERLTGPLARERVLKIIDWLREHEVLATGAEADALLIAANLAPLHPAAALPLERQLAEQLPEPPPPLSPGVAYQRNEEPPRSLRLPHASQLSTLIAEKTEGFIGRDYIFQAIDTFIHNQPNGYFTIEGDPGVGKSAILAEYVRRVGCPAHFNDRRIGIITTTQFLENIFTQLIVRYNLPHSTLPATATRDGAFLLQVLDEAAAELGQDERLVIAIDALDEVTTQDQTPGANILYLPSILPKGVYIVTTRRAVAINWVIQSPQQILKIKDYQAESLQDIQTYIHRAMLRPGLQAWVAKKHLDEATFVTILAEKSEQNFMYLRYILPDIEQGVYQDLSVEHLPNGLMDYYEDHWNRMGMRALPIPKTRLDVVYILSEVRQPVSLSLLAEIAGADALTVQTILDEWKQFLHRLRVEDHIRYSVYHTSFRDFLNQKEIMEAARMTIKDVNARIANYFWKSLFGDDAVA